MIGLILRGITSELGGGLWIVVGSAFACCAICGIYKCAKCNLRDCGCIKSCLRFVGADKFSDFEIIVLVHEMKFLSKEHNKPEIFVRVSAGAQKAETDYAHNGIYQQPLVIFVEQGTPYIVLTAVAKNGTVYATLKLNTHKLVEEKDEVEKVYNMKAKTKHILNAQITLTLRIGNDEEKALIGGVDMSAETDLLLRKQLSKKPSRLRPDISELDLLCNGCSGPLEMIGGWGRITMKYVAILCPPAERRYRFCIWEDEKSYHKGRKPEMVMDLKKILNVSPDPGRPDVFILDYVKHDRSRQKATFRRIDRTRDVWVEVLHLVIKMVRESRAK